VHCTHQGKGDAVLFIHGMPTNRMLWSGVIQQLSSHHRCFAVDLPGMGETPFIPYGPGYLDRMAKQIEQLRIQHGVKRWHVVGHDAGSAIAVQYAGQFSRGVACLALLSPAIFPELKPFYLLNALRRPLVGELLAPLFHFVFWRIAMRRAIAGESNRALLRAFYRPFSGPKGAWQLMRLVRWGRPEDMLGEIPAKLPALQMPTLLFHGLRDVLPAAFAERAASLIPNSTVITLDAGHFIPLNRPNEVAARLRSFFRENHATMESPVRTRKLSKGNATALVVVTKALSLEGRQSVAGVL
jgi:pimeloyl-ACP methyl ester carboxylesterase